MKELLYYEWEYIPKQIIMNHFRYIIIIIYIYKKKKILEYIKMLNAQVYTNNKIYSHLKEPNILKKLNQYDFLPNLF